MDILRRATGRRGRPLLLLVLLAAANLAAALVPAHAQVNAGPAAPALAGCAKKVNAAHPFRPENGPALSPARLQALSKGVNLTDVFSPGVSAARIGNDVARLRSLGLRHARIPIDPGWVLSWRPGSADQRLARLDDTVCQALSAGLAIILDVHPEGSLALNDTAAVDTLDALGLAWDRLGARYAAFTPELMFFEALNEPALKNAARWEPAQRTLLAHIRQAAPNHTILLTATPDSTAGALAGLTPVDDANVAYVFHFYSPMVFTHQGAEWASPDFGSIRGLAYPAERGNSAGVRDRARASFQQPLADYLDTYANSQAIQAEIDVAARWAASNDVHLVVTEFGVYGAAAQASRAAWLRDVRKALEAHAIGWTVWEYRGGFGIDGELSRGCASEQAVGNALGLCDRKNAPSRR